MRQSKALLKAAAVGCSVVLAAGFVSYRAGAFDWLSRPAAPSVSPGPAAAADPEPGQVADQPASSSPLAAPAILSSSKSAIIVAPSSEAPQAGSRTAAPAPTFIGGSKSLAPLIPPSPPAAQSPNPAK